LLPLNTVKRSGVASSKNVIPFIILEEAKKKPKNKKKTKE